MFFQYFHVELVLNIPSAPNNATEALCFWHIAMENI
jgi:hypothetical protein